MKKMRISMIVFPAVIFSMFFAPDANTSVQAQSLYGDFRACAPSCREKSFFDGIEYFGWVQTGVYMNNHGSSTKRFRDLNSKGSEKSFLEPTSGNSALLSTVQTTDFQVNQLWGGIGKTADGSRGLDWGFAAEAFFGTEAWIGQSWNDASFDYGWQSGDYYLSIPQLYFQFAYGNLSLKMGKFDTLLGYESMRAPDNFFYSHAHIFMMEPYSHTGFLFDYTPTDRLTLSAGYVTGGDTGFSNRYDDHGFLGAIDYRITDRIGLNYSIVYTKYSPEEFYRSGIERPLYDCENVLQTVAFGVDLTDQWFYSLQWNFGDTKNFENDAHYIMYGISNNLTWQINPCWAVGTRMEWARDKRGEYLGSFDGDVFAITLGLQWTPCTNLSIRPEIRYDQTACKTERYFNDGKDRSQLSGGICLVYSLR